MAQKLQILRTSTANSPPTALLPGELSVEMGVPLRLWVGVPTNLDATGKKLLADPSSYASGPALGGYLPLTGGTLSGFLNLHAAPTAPLHAATKAYADTKTDTAYVNTQTALRVLKAGDVMTGQLTLNYATPSFTLHKTVAGQGAYIDTYAASVRRWRMAIGDATTEDFFLSSYDNAGVHMGYPLRITRGGLGSVASFSGNVNVAGILDVNSNLDVAGGGWIRNGLNVTGQISASTHVVAGNNVYAGTHMTTLLAPIGLYIKPTGPSDAIIALTKSATGLTNVITGSNGAEYRWTLHMGDNSAESGTAVGSNFTIGAYNNSNVLIGNMFWLRRDTKAATVYAEAYKPGGGSWASSSDERIKTVLGNYQQGLAAIKQLMPVRYTYKGNETLEEPVAPTKLADEDPDPMFRSDQAPYLQSPTRFYAQEQKTCIGLVAQAVEGVMPEMVQKVAAWIDGAPVTDLRNLDTSPLIFALVKIGRAHV